MSMTSFQHNIEKNHITMALTFIVDIDRELAYLIPEYLEGRKRDIVSIRKALQERDFETIRIIGHNMRGTGGGYGFNELTDIGSEIQQWALAKNTLELERVAGRLHDYLERVSIRYV